MLTAESSLNVFLEFYGIIILEPFTLNFLLNFNWLAEKLNLQYLPVISAPLISKFKKVNILMNRIYQDFIITSWTSYIQKWI